MLRQHPQSILRGDINMRRTGMAQSEWQGGKILELEKKIRAGIDRNPVLGCDAAIIAIIH